MIIIVTLIIAANINEQKLFIQVGYSVDCDKRYRLLMGEGTFEAVSFYYYLFHYSCPNLTLYRAKLFRIGGEILLLERFCLFVCLFNFMT